MTVNLTKSGKPSLNPRQLLILRAMRDAVVAKGLDYVYPKPLMDMDAEGTCLYLTYDENNEPTGPSCIVGHALVNSGVMHMNTIREYEYTAADEVDALKNTDPGVPPHLGDPFRGAMRHGQVRQDAGETWGIAWQTVLSHLRDYYYVPSEFDLH